MTPPTLAIGSVQVTAVCDVGADRGRLRDWCFVVRSRDRVVLVDTGVGPELAAAGVEPEEIDLVVLTHLHLDHAGWNLAWDGDRPRPRFPRARYLVQRADWELFAHEGDDDDREAFDRCVRPLRDLGVADLVDGDRVLSGELSLLHTPGHTPGSQSLLVRSGTAAVLCWGDVANHPAQVGRPDWGPASDVLPQVAQATRRRLLERVETEAMWLAPSHFPEPFGTLVRDDDGGRRWRGRR
jgi:glyoxylase-like metal-dependent hydrolase (beta-lactamase superfamily II)